MLVAWHPSSQEYLLPQKCAKPKDRPLLSWGLSYCRLAAKTQSHHSFDLTLASLASYTHACLSVLRIIIIYMCTCVHVHVCTIVCEVCICGDWRPMSCVFLYLNFWDRISHWTWSSLFWWRQLAIGPGDLSLSAPLSLGLKCPPSCLVFDMGAEDVNSGLKPTKPSSQLCFSLSQQHR